MSDQRLEGVFSHLRRKRSCQGEGRGSRWGSSPGWVPLQLFTCCLPQNLEGQTLLAHKVPVPKCWPSAEAPLAAPVVLSISLSLRILGALLHSVRTGCHTGVVGSKKGEKEERKVGKADGAA